jgi:hypothetical protein
MIMRGVPPIGTKVKKMRKIVFGCVLAFSLITVADVSGQTARALHQSSASYEATGEMGRLEVASASKELKWVWSSSGGPLESRVAQLAVASFQVGAVHHVGDMSFLVTGRIPNGDAVIARVLCLTAATRQVVVQEVRSYAAADIVGIAFNDVENRLYVLDYIGRRALYADWAGPAAPLPAALSGAVDSGTLPILSGDLLQTYLRCDDLPSGVAVGRANSDVAFRVFYSGGSWSVARTVSGDSGLRLRNPDLITTSTMWVTGPMPTSFNVIEVFSGQVVYSGLVVAPWQAAHVQFSPPLVAGRHYQVVEVGQATGQSFRPLLRYGAPQVLDGISVLKGFAPGSQAYVGEPRFAVGCEVHLASPASEQEIHSSALWLAVVPENQPDPVVIVGEVAVLQPSVVVYGLVKFKVGADVTGAAFPFAIPNEPLLAGHRILAQILVQDAQSGQLTFTDVFGVAIASLAESGVASIPSLAEREAILQQMPVSQRERLQALYKRHKSGLNAADQAHVRDWTRRMLLRTLRRQ